jgi:4-amino-4-deoxy-L-arabinose transferase-like glycosyltransferase
MDLTKIIQTHFSNPQLAWIICALALGMMSIVLFLRGKQGYSLLFLFLAGLILRVVTAALDPFLWIWDEQYHALVAKNMVMNPFKPMLISNPVLDYDFRNWLENHIWLHKQPFFLWQIALFFKIFGTSEFVLRLPTVIMMSLMILLIYRIGKLTSTPAIAWYGAFLYTFSFYFVQFVSGWKFTDHNDSAFIFYVTLSIWSWAEFIDSNKKRWLLLIGLFAGIAILNKWLTGLLVYSGWSLAIFLCSSHREWFSEHKKMGISLLVTILVVLPWQIFTLVYYPIESRFEFLYSSWHFSRPLDGHGETWYYNFALLSEQYGGKLVWFLILPGLYYLFKSIQNKVYKVSLLTCLIITYLFFTLAATKTPMYCAIVSPFLFLALGAILDKGVAKLRKFIPARFSVWILAGLLGILAYDLLDINQIDEWHSDKLSFWKTQNIDAIIDKQVALKLPSKDWVVFNCGGNNAVMLMFYSGATAYGYYPTATQYSMLKSKGIKMATFADEYTPGYLKQDASVMKFYMKPVYY